MRLTNPVVLVMLGAALAATPAVASPAADGHAEDSHGEHGDGAHGDSHGDAAHGEHDEGHGAGHHSPSPWEDDNGNGVANFLDGEDEHYADSWGFPVWLQWVWHLMNLLILVGGLVFMARKPLSAALRDRFLGIKKELDESAELEQTARAKFEELESRLVSFEDEVAQMKAEAVRALGVEKEEAAARAAAAVERVRESAERTIRDETNRATLALRTEAVELAVQLAEETLRNEVGSADRQRLARDLLSSLGPDAAAGSPNG